LIGISQDTGRILSSYQAEMEAEYDNILAYWIKHAPDNDYGGFQGKINNTNEVAKQAPKGVVLNCRILWTFSAAYRLKRTENLLTISNRSFNYIQDYFCDLDFGGLFWLVDYSGRPLDSKKQIYAQAFGIYALSEHFRSTGTPPAREMAIDLFELIETHSYDKKHLGYIDAFSRDWKEIQDLRLSEKDANEKKTMNTHLHIVEAYANLYRIWPDSILKKRIVELLEIFSTYIIDKNTGHLRLFFDEKWTSKTDLISFGHDIEAAWLLLEAAQVIKEKNLVEKYSSIAVSVADAVLKQGIDKDGGIWYEYEPSHQKLINEKHWWPQAEAMLGFFNAWEISGDKKFLEASLKSWDFTKNHILDKKNGEWYWGVRADYSVMEEEDKVGIWKCPYHNARTCMELVKRINMILK
jgi:cellobiose epimerase